MRFKIDLVRLQYRGEGDMLLLPRSVAEYPPEDILNGFLTNEVSKTYEDILNEISNKPVSKSETYPSKAEIEHYGFKYKFNFDIVINTKPATLSAKEIKALELDPDKNPWPGTAAHIQEEGDDLEDVETVDKISNITCDVEIAVKTVSHAGGGHLDAKSPSQLFYLSSGNSPALKTLSDEEKKQIKETNNLIAIDKKNELETILKKLVQTQPSRRFFEIKTKPDETPNEKATKFVIMIKEAYKKL